MAVLAFFRVTSTLLWRIYDEGSQIARSPCFARNHWVQKRWFGSFCFIFSGCGGPHAHIQISELLSGVTWAVRSIAAPGTDPQACPATIVIGSDRFSCGAQDLQVFRQDGTFTDVATGTNGTYTLRGSTLSVSAKQSVFTSMVFINGNTLTEQTDQPSGFPIPPGTIGHPVVLTTVLVKQ